jgi:hypothetical protein
VIGAIEKVGTNDLLQVKSFMTTGARHKRWLAIRTRKVVTWSTMRSAVLARIARALGHNRHHRALLHKRSLEHAQPRVSAVVARDWARVEEEHLHVALIALHLS